MKTIHNAKGKIKKTLSIFLTFCMVFGMVPTMVFAGDAASVDYSDYFEDIELTFVEQPSYELYDLEATTKVNFFADGKRDNVYLNEPVIMYWYVSKTAGERGTEYHRDSERLTVINNEHSNDQKVEFKMPASLFVTRTWGDPEGTYYITCVASSRDRNGYEKTVTSEQI